MKVRKSAAFLISISIILTGIMVNGFAEIDPTNVAGLWLFDDGGGVTVKDTSGNELDGEIIGADIVEYNPVRDVNGVTAMIAAKFTKEIAAQMISQI